MKRVLSVLLLLLTSASALSAGEKYAFLVAVKDYDQKQLKPLKYTRNDISEFATILRQAGYRSSNIKLMHDDLKTIEGVRYLPEAERIRREFGLLLGRLEPEDSLIVAFAGHGVQFKGESESYFCPLDADLSDRETLLPIAGIYEQLKQCSARKKLLIVDACRNDPQTSISRSINNTELQSVTRPQLTTPPKGVVALFSCAPGQQAFEWDDYKHGLFFRQLLDGWKGKADNGDGDITLDEVVAYTKRNTARVADLYLSAAQTPRQVGAFEGSWLLTRKPIISGVPVGGVPGAVFFLVCNGEIAGKKACLR